MAANNVEIAFRLLSGIKKDFIRNLLWLHQQQQRQQNTNQQQEQQNINQFTSSAPTVVISETSSRNAFDETEENGLDQQNIG